MTPHRSVRHGGTIEVWLRTHWPIVAMILFVILGTAAFVVVGNVVSDLQTEQAANKAQQEQILETQNKGRQIICALSRAITANPIVRIPAFETEAAFNRRVRALRLILSLTRGVDCVAALAPVSTKGVELQPLPGGGEAQSPQTGGQLAGGTRAPPLRRSLNPHHSRSPSRSRSRDRSVACSARSCRAPASSVRAALDNSYP